MQHAMNQKGLPCNDDFKLLLQSYDCRGNPIGPLYDEKVCEALLLYVLRIAFLVSLFCGHDIFLNPVLRLKPTRLPMI